MKIEVKHKKYFRDLTLKEHKKNVLEDFWLVLLSVHSVEFRMNQQKNHSVCIFYDCF